MEKKQVLSVFRFFTWVVLFNFLFVSAWADNPLVPNWNLVDINGQIRTLTTNYSGPLAILGAGSRTGNVTNSRLNVNGLTVDTGSTDADRQAAYENGADFITGGVVYNQTANGNSVFVQNGATIQGRSVVGGMSLLSDPESRLGTGSANNNTVSIKDSTISSVSWTPSGSSDPTTTGGDVVGGYSDYANGSTNNNTVTVDNSTVAGNVWGGRVLGMENLIPGTDWDLTTGQMLVDTDMNANNNKISILNSSTINGNVIGSSGANFVTGNQILIDNSTVVGDVYAADNSIAVATSGTTTAYASFDNNKVEVRNGSSVASAHAVIGFSTNAKNNSLIVDNSTVSNGSLRTVVMDVNHLGNPINADVSSNSLDIKNVSSALNVQEIGAALNLAGVASNNKTTLSNLSALTATRSVGDLSFKVLDWTNLNNQYLIGLKNVSNVFVPTDNFNSSYGFVYGGAALDYVSQTNDLDTPPALVNGELPAYATTAPAEEVIANGGMTADGNTLRIADSTVSANVIGGMAGEFRERNYTTWTYTPGSGLEPANYTKTVTQKMGSTIVVINYNCGATGTTCTITGEPVFSEEEAPENDFSASNNTVILENTAFDGTVYGGYVVGADLDNTKVKTTDNKVILRGNTTLSAGTVLYGGSSSFGTQTNYLVFDHVANGNNFVTYSDRNQFKNFNDIWKINADLDTRLSFDFAGVNALVTVDGNNLEGSQTIIKTQTTTDLTDVEQNGVVSDLIDTSIELEQKKKGVYSYTLVGQKEDATTVGWVLTGYRDHKNVETYGQVPLAGLALATEGPEMLAASIREAWLNDNESNAFVNGGYHHTRYETGSGFDLNSGLVQAGWWKKVTNEFLLGFFAKYAHGSYETYPIKASGDADVYGGGLMTSVRYSETGRIEANVEVGNMDIEFTSNQLGSTLESSGIYYGAMFGLVEAPSDVVELYANVQYLRKNKDDMTDNLGQTINYSTMQSLALRAGMDFALKDIQLGGFIPSFGVSAIYELDGKSKVSVASISNDEASMRGLSGRGEFSLSYHSDDSVLPITSKLTAFGQAGKRRGFGGEVNISFLF